MNFKKFIYANDIESIYVNKISSNKLYKFCVLPVKQQLLTIPTLSVTSLLLLSDLNEPHRFSSSVIFLNR
jgi:hypothetical protein